MDTRLIVLNIMVAGYFHAFVAVVDHQWAINLPGIMY